jgi:hypothetical protein
LVVATITPLSPTAMQTLVVVQAMPRRVAPVPLHWRPQPDEAPEGAHGVAVAVGGGLAIAVGVSVGVNAASMIDRRAAGSADTPADGAMIVAAISSPRMASTETVTSFSARP